LVKRTLCVTNSNQQPVAYKVKTTAPKQYCVRPNSGRIEPGETVEVQVLLQPMKEEPAPGTKCRDKFLVQSVVIDTAKQDLNLQELWSTVEKQDKTSIHEQKIRCAFLAPQDGVNGTYPIQEEEARSLRDENYT
ncbi:phosphatidylinositol-binding protein scs2, partial [Microbotryomycetes sp. JL201]